MIVTLCIENDEVCDDVCHCMYLMCVINIALFAAHSTWLWCNISVCICVTVLEFVHVCTDMYYVW